MKAILVLNNNNVRNLRIMVSLTERILQKQVTSLLKQHQEREAFQILRYQAKFMTCLTMGKKAPARVDVTLFEDML